MPKSSGFYTNTVAKVNTDRWVILFSILIFLSVCVKLSTGFVALEELLVGVDDWNRYARHALDIKYNGWLIPSVNQVYNGPGGFLYNYFLALVFTIFGDQTLPVYVIQGILLSISFVLIFKAFEKLFKGSEQIVFAAILSVAVILDFTLNYTVILLSENLGIIFFSWGIYLLSRDRTNLLFYVVAGLAILTRPNLLPIFAIIIVFRLLGNIRSFSRKVVIKLITGGGVLILILGVLPARNYLITGEIRVMPVEGMSDGLNQLLSGNITYFFDKILFCIGFLRSLMPEYMTRPHWILMWGGYILYFITAVRFDHLKLKIVHVMIGMFFLTNVLFVTVGSYGYRSMLFLLPLIIPFALRFFFDLFGRRIFTGK